MKDVSRLTEVELAMEIEQLEKTGEDPERLEQLRNEAMSRAIADGW